MKKPKPLADRITKAMLEKLRKRKMTNDEAAAELGVSSTYLSSVVSRMQKKVPGVTAPIRLQKRKLHEARTEIRRTLAQKVLKGRITVEEAALQAGCSKRTIFRYAAEYKK